MTIGHKLGLRLFLEGIEVPVVGATITVAANSPATCAAQVVATDKLLEILPRTLVHLFFYDFVAGEADAKTGSLTSDPEDIENSAYKLLFMGEVQGIAFQKGAGTRDAMLNCVDLSNYWDTTYQYNFKGSLIGKRKYASFIGANANLFNGPLAHGEGKISALLTGRSVNYPELKGLLAGIVHVLEAIGGSYYGDNTFKGANDFTSIAELRLKILQQICAAEKDDSTAKLFARKTFNRWLNRRTGSLGKLVTFRGLTQLLQKFVFHEIYPCPVAKYEPIREATKKKTYATDIGKDPRSRKFVEKVKRLRNLLYSATLNLSEYPYSTPAELPMTGPTYTGGQTRSTVVRQLGNDLSAANRVVNALKGSGTPNVPGLDKEVAKIDDSLRKVTKNIGQGSSVFGSINLDVIKMGFGKNRNAASKALNDAIDACNQIVGVRIKKKREVSYEKRDRLNNQIFRPDIWFTPPPRCNVLFPEFYMSFNWSRNFLREVSRLELQTTSEILGDDALFNGRYYSPNVADMRQGVKMSSRKFGRLTLAHELMTGIIPMFEKMSEANLFAMQSRMVKHKGAPVPYAQRAADFQYFKHRFASRQMQCQGRFNPWFVPGFPGLVIDRPMDSDKLTIAGMKMEDQLRELNIKPKKGIEITRGTILRQLVPTQFLGSCVQLTHSLSQQGGNTSYAFAQARVHRESTEYLGVDMAAVNKKIGTSTRTTPVAATPTRAPKEKKRGPRGGTITKVVEATDQYLNHFLPVYGEGRNAEAQIGSSEEEEFTMGRSSEEHYKAYEVTENIDRRERINVDLPMEEAIRPPWVWDGYSNLRIGETHLQFFGTNSITDIEGYTSDELLTLIESEDVYLATLESQEGLRYGEKKKVEEDTVTASRTDKQRPQDKPRKNKVEKGGASQEKETGKKVSSSAILAMQTDRTMESSIDYLVRVYSFIKHRGLGTGEFLRNYSWRPVATLPQIMGSAKFNITKNEDFVPPPGSSIKKEDKLTFTRPEYDQEGEYIITGKEGFHSRAFGDRSDLFGLVDPKVKRVLGLSIDTNHATAKRLDVRGIRRAAISEYVRELTASRGLLG